ncbi:hypothetical protein ACUY2R_09980 [Corynebacterium mastitidis]
MVDVISKTNPQPQSYGDVIFIAGMPKDLAGGTPARYPYMQEIPDRGRGDYSHTAGIIMSGFKIPKWLYGAALSAITLEAILLFLFSPEPTINKVGLVGATMTAATALMTLYQRTLSDNRSEWWHRFEWLVNQENGDHPDWLLLYRIYDNLFRERKWARPDAPLQASVYDRSLRCLLEHYSLDGRLEEYIEAMEDLERKHVYSLMFRYRIGESRNNDPEG